MRSPARVAPLASGHCDNVRALRTMPVPACLAEPVANKLAVLAHGVSWHYRPYVACKRAHLRAANNWAGGRSLGPSRSAVSGAARAIARRRSSQESSLWKAGIVAGIAAAIVLGPQPVVCGGTPICSYIGSL